LDDGENAGACQLASHVGTVEVVCGDRRRKSPTPPGRSVFYDFVNMLTDSVKIHRKIGKISQKRTK
jgi:hypothetical protein